jgi:3-deoxy-D-manno-octulosonate 8-phosphate phosphatase (KDO 8-P phosphatase)
MRRPDLPSRMARIRWLILDVDGVLTDGHIVYSDSGEELKRFHVRDGSGLKLWRAAGNSAAVISGRSSPAVTRRAAELGIAPVLQGREDKATATPHALVAIGAAADECCAIGDDWADLPVLRACGVAVAVADAAEELRSVADYVTETPGGHGAVRETIEWLLRSTGRWPNPDAGPRPTG